MDIATRTPDTPGFPPGFVWGVATASYQIEGAASEDGRGPSIWDTFCRVPGAVRNGDTGDVACDHYHRMPEDVELMDALGVGAYRFSVAWPRVQPDGRGAVEARGLDFYRRLVDRLRERGIAPIATLYHWDLPQPLEDAGGWPARDTALRFAEYAAIVHEALADGVAAWITLNEPWCSAFLGYAVGVHAPGRRDEAASLAAAHHLLLGHGLAVRALREQGAQAPLGITLNFTAARAGGHRAADFDAVRRMDGTANRWFIEPLRHGAYPADVVADLADVTDFGFVADGDLQVIASPIDWLGVNYYTCMRAVASDGDGDGGQVGMPGLRGVRPLPPHPPTTSMGWEQDPDSFRELLVRLGREYPGLPMVVTENGSAWDDLVGTDGAVHDPQRVAYLDGHLRALREAVRLGADVRGYLAWSLMDNFEWAEGYAQRFGLVHVDYPTQRRTLKDSARYYRAVIADGLPLVPYLLP